jgi:hypothetical protein
MRATQRASSSPSISTRLLSSVMPSSYCSTAGQSHMTSTGELLQSRRLGNMAIVQVAWRVEYVAPRAHWIVPWSTCLLLN